MEAVALAQALAALRVRFLVILTLAVEDPEAGFGLYCNIKQFSFLLRYVDLWAITAVLFCLTGRIFFCEFESRNVL